MRVLILGYVWPEPGSSAAGKRTMDLIHQFLDQGWKVDFASSAALSDHRVPLDQFGIQEHRVTLNCDSFDELLKSLNPDIVIFDRFFTEEQFGWRVERCCPQALRIIDTIDLHSLRETRQSSPELVAPSDLRKAMFSNDKTLRELAAIFRSDLSLIISDFEMNFLKEQFTVPESLLHYESFSIDKVPSLYKSYDERKDFVSLGNFRHPPNWDSVLWLKKEIWPLIRLQLPTAQLKVYGAYPPSKAMELHQPKEGFHVLGWAENALSVMQEARVCLAPLRFGAGLKGKLLDALLAGTPSVTTSVGAEGMQGNLPWSGFVANSVDEIADSAVRLYQQQPLWERSQEQGREILKTQFSKKSELIPRLVKLFDQKNELRESNFVGQMLRHHLLQSTKHLSNWIQLKNQIK